MVIATARSSRLATETFMRGPLSYSPPCHLRLDGGFAPAANCEILELTAEGASIAMTGDQAALQGQHGRLVIGPPEGDHYELPVDVSWVKLADRRSVVGLTLQNPPHWRFARS